MTVSTIKRLIIDASELVDSIVNKTFLPPKLAKQSWAKVLEKIEGILARRDELLEALDGIGPDLDEMQRLKGLICQLIPLVSAIESMREDPQNTNDVIVALEGLKSKSINVPRDAILSLIVQSNLNACVEADDGAQLLAILGATSAPTSDTMDAGFISVLSLTDSARDSKIGDFVIKTLSNICTKKKDDSMLKVVTNGICSAVHAVFRQHDQQCETREAMTCFRRALDADACDLSDLEEALKVLEQKKGPLATVVQSPIGASIIGIAQSIRAKRVADEAAVQEISELKKPEGSLVHAGSFWVKGSVPALNQWNSYGKGVSKALAHASDELLQSERVKKETAELHKALSILIDSGTNYLKTEFDNLCVAVLADLDRRADVTDHKNNFLAFQAALPDEAKDWGLGPILVSKLSDMQDKKRDWISRPEVWCCRRGRW